MLSKILIFIKPFFIVLVIILGVKAIGLSDEPIKTTQMATVASSLHRASDVQPGTADDIFDYNFSIKDLAGNKTPISQFKGKVIFLNLWATWCPPCRAEMPTIQKLYDVSKNENVVFVMLSLDKDVATPKIETFIKAKAFTFPVYQPSGFLTEQLNIPVIPTTFIISKEGKVLARETGYTNFNTSKYKNLLAKEAVR